MANMRGMANESKEQRWAAQVAEWQASGLSAREYCVGRDFNHRELYGRAYRLKRRAANVAAAPKAGGSMKLVRVEMAAVTKDPGPAESAPLSIDLGSARVAVPAGCDGATLRMVLEVLASTGRGGRP